MILKDFPQYTVVNKLIYYSSFGSINLKPFWTL